MRAHCLKALLLNRSDRNVSVPSAGANRYDECGGYWDSELPSGPVAEVPLLKDQPAVGSVYGMQQPWPPPGAKPYHFRWMGE